MSLENRWFLWVASLGVFLFLEDRFLRAQETSPPPAHLSAAQLAEGVTHQQRAILDALAPSAAISTSPTGPLGVSAAGSVTGFPFQNPGYSTGYSEREATVLRDFSSRGGGFDPASAGVNMAPVPSFTGVYDPDGVPINRDVPLAVPQTYGAGAFAPSAAGLPMGPLGGPAVIASPAGFGLTKAFAPSAATGMVAPTFDQAMLSALSAQNGVLQAGQGQLYGKQLGDAVKEYNQKLSDYFKQQVQQANIVNTVQMMSPQVLIKARIIQVVRTDLTDVGSVLDIVAHNPQGMDRPSYFLDGTMVKQRNFTFKSNFPVPFTNGPGATLEITGKHIDAIITALQQEFKADTVAAPQLTVLNDQEATFASGASIPFFFGRNNTLDSTNHTQEIFYKNVGVTLEVTPHVLTRQEIDEAFDATSEGQDLAFLANNGKINPDQYQEQRRNLVDQAGAGQPIVLTIAYRISDPDTANFSTGQDGTPIMVNAEKAVRAGYVMVRVHNGCGIVISGLINETASDNITKVPVLGDLPLVGNAFRRKTQDREKFETLIFVEARLVGICDPAADHYEYADRHLPGGPPPGTPHPPFSQVPLAPLEGHQRLSETVLGSPDSVRKAVITGIEILK